MKRKQRTKKKIKNKEEKENERPNKLICGFNHYDCRMSDKMIDQLSQSQNS